MSDLIVERLKIDYGIFERKAWKGDLVNFAKIIYRVDVHGVLQFFSRKGIGIDGAKVVRLQDRIKMADRMNFMQGQQDANAGVAGIQAIDGSMCRHRKKKLGR
jgi:hypothetical protein